MHKRFCLFIISSFTLALINLSCAKHLNDPGPSDRLISYSLSASNYQPFSNIIYTDSVGSQGTASAADSISPWIKTIATFINPFNAQMEVQGLNNTSGTISYTISIYVDGIIKATKQDSVLKFASFDSQINTVVQ